MIEAMLCAYVQSGISVDLIPTCAYCQTAFQKDDTNFHPYFQEYKTTSSPQQTVDAIHFNFDNPSSKDKYLIFN